MYIALNKLDALCFVVSPYVVFAISLSALLHLSVTWMLTVSDNNVISLLPISQFCFFL